MPKIKTSTGVIKFKTKPLYSGIKIIDQIIAKENLEILVSTLKKHNLQVGLMYGSMLGAVREHGFIPHDEDIDLFFLQENKQRVIDTIPDLMREGFEVVRYDRCDLLSVMRKGEYIDFYFFYKDEQEPQYRKCSGGVELARFLEETIEIDFLGINVIIPKDYEGYLLCHFGPNWRTPIVQKNYNVSFLERIKFAFKFWLKDIMPDFIYMPLKERSEKHVREIHMNLLERYYKNGGHN